MFLFLFLLMFAFVRFSFWLALALLTMAVMVLAAIVWLPPALARKDPKTARAVWSPAMVCARATDDHRRWLLPNTRPAS